VKNFDRINSKELQRFKLWKGPVDDIRPRAKRTIHCVSAKLSVSDRNCHCLPPRVAAHLVFGVCLNTDTLRPIGKRRDIRNCRISDRVRVHKQIARISNNLRFDGWASWNGSRNSTAIILCWLGFTAKQARCHNEQGKSFHHKSLILVAERHQPNFTLTASRNQGRKFAR